MIIESAIMDFPGFLEYDFTILIVVDSPIMLAGYLRSRSVLTSLVYFSDFSAFVSVTIANKSRLLSWLPIMLFLAHCL
jgi:hypothetical protein